MSDEISSVRPNPYIFDIENRRKRKPRLAHDLGAGAKCRKCGDKCPGFELHFWRYSKLLCSFLWVDWCTFKMKKWYLQLLNFLYGDCCWQPWSTYFVLTDITFCEIFMMGVIGFCTCLNYLLLKVTVVLWNMDALFELKDLYWLSSFPFTRRNERLSTCAFLWFDYCALKFLWQLSVHDDDFDTRKISV